MKRLISWSVGSLAQLGYNYKYFELRRNTSSDIFSVPLTIGAVLAPGALARQFDLASMSLTASTFSASRRLSTGFDAARWDRTSNFLVARMNDA
jgi:hypothetical protein